MFWFDILLFLILIGSMFMGFSQGVIRQGLNLFAIFFGLLVAATYQPRVARFIEGMVGQTSDFVRNTLTFILVVVVVWIAVNVAVYFAFRQTQLQTGQTLDRLLGLALGLFNGIVWCAIIVLVVTFMTRVPWPEYDGVRKFWFDGLQSSILEHRFRALIPPLADLLRQIVPSGNLPPIFTITNN